MVDPRTGKIINPIPVLNWFAKNRRMTQGLRALFKKRRGNRPPESFVTIRLGGKWFRKVTGNRTVLVSISNNPEKPDIVGHAKVLCSQIGLLKYFSDELAKNIGAKTIAQAAKDMSAAYGLKVTPESVVTVLELMPEV